MKETFLIFLYLSIICKSNFILLPIIKKLKGYNKKNLVIGVIDRYSWIKVKPFFISYIKANFKNCDCVIFYRNINDETLNRIRSLGIIMLEISKQYNRMKINNVRYKIYEDYLSNKLDKYNMVLHVDVRDTYFQKDVFKFYKNKKHFIGLALEDGNLTDKFSRNWIKGQYGNVIYEELKNKTIICSGTIWGTVDNFFKMVKFIWKEIEKKSSYSHTILDQSSENYLIYHKNMFNDCKITSDIYSGPVMTVGLSKFNFSYDSEDNLLNLKGDIAAVIHQYDRKPKMVEIVKKKFIDIPYYIILNDLMVRKNNEDDYIYIKYIIYKICIIIIIFIIIFFSRSIYLKHKFKNIKKRLQKIIKMDEKRKEYKKAKILKL